MHKRLSGLRVHPSGCRYCWRASVGPLLSRANDAGESDAAHHASSQGWNCGLHYEFGSFSDACGGSGCLASTVLAESGWASVNIEMLSTTTWTPTGCSAGLAS